MQHQSCWLYSNLSTFFTTIQPSFKMTAIDKLTNHPAIQDLGSIPGLRRREEEVRPLNSVQKPNPMRLVRVFKLFSIFFEGRQQEFTLNRAPLNHFRLQLSEGVQYNSIQSSPSSDYQLHVSGEDSAFSVVYDVICITMMYCNCLTIIS